MGDEVLQDVTYRGVCQRGTDQPKRDDPHFRQNDQSCAPNRVRSTRRIWMKQSTAALAASAGLAGCRALDPPSLRVAGPVFIGKADSYEADLKEVLLRGLRELRIDPSGKRILLKPNLVEFDRNTCINTDPRVVQAAIDAFLTLGAAEVRIAEGPGHRRDTMGLAEESGYLTQIPGFEDRFTDLNRDDVTLVRDFGLRPEFYFPNALLAADWIVSVAKMKTHHWAGATLSMKNFFGVVPGSVYGWPKNELHQLGIPQSIAALAKYFQPKSLGIVDGILGMEGNGPIQGTPKRAGVLVLGADLLSLDTTCCKVMGLDPFKFPYLTRSGLSASYLDTLRQRGEEVKNVATVFRPAPNF
jgi:uncharacterized protein (DUF362 family)